MIEAGHRFLVRLGISVLVEDEIEAERQLADEGHYRPLLVRQSAFYEELLTLWTMIAFQSYKEDTLTRRELEIIDQMGHTDRIRIAHLLGIIDEEEHGMLQSMATRRNDIAHNAWSGIEPEELTQIESISKGVLELLEDLIKEPEELESKAAINSAGDDFDMGFSALDTATQLLQLGILDVLSQKGGEAPLTKVQSILLQPDSEIENRVNLMEQIGYIDIDNGSIRLLPDGEQLLREEL